MAKQYRVEITYSDDSTEQYVIHSNRTVEWVQQQREKTVEAFVTLFATSYQVTEWFKANQAKKLEVKEEEE